MESGLFFGYVGMVEGLVRRMTDELGGQTICVATGGLAAVYCTRDEALSSRGYRFDVAGPQDRVGSQSP